MLIFFESRGCAKTILTIPTGNVVAVSQRSVPQRSVTHPQASLGVVSGWW